MQILPSRYLVLKYILDAYAILPFNVPLVCYDGKNVIPFSGTSTSWTGSFDDIGIFVLIPKLVTFFHVSLDTGINIFFYGLFYGSLICGLTGLLLLYRSLLMRIVIFFATLLFLKISLYATDVYSAYCAAIMGVIPLFLYFCQQRPHSIYLKYFIGIAGIFLGMLHYIRSYSCLPALGFMMFYLIVHHGFDYRRKVYLIVFLLGGIMISKNYFDAIIQEYKDYAKIHFDTSQDLPTQHPIWHTIYAGFGLLKWPNIDDIAYDDGCIERMVTKDDPSVSFFTMNEYERIAKNRVLDLCKKQKLFVIMTLFAKLGILLFYLLISANIGLITAVLCHKKWQLEWAFFIGFSLSSLFPLIAVPISMFSLSFLTFGVLYGIMSVNHFLYFKEKAVHATIKKIMHVLKSRAIVSRV